MLNYEFTNTGECSAMVNIGGVIFSDEEIEGFDVTETIIDDTKLSVGNTCNATATVRLINNRADTSDNPKVSESTLTNQSLKIWISDSAGATEDDVPLGVFVTKDVSVDGLITTVKAEGRFTGSRFTQEYKSRLEWEEEHSLAEVVNDVYSIDTIDTSLLTPTYYIEEEPSGYTKKEILGYIGAVYGLNMMLSRTGIPTYKKIPAADEEEAVDILPSNTFALSVNYAQTQISEVVIAADEEDADYSIDNPSDIYNNIQMEINCPIIPDNAVLPLGNMFLGYKYTAFSADILGDPNIEAGDKISVTDVKGNVYEGIAFSVTHSYNGAYTQSIVCSTDNTNTQSRKKTGGSGGGTATIKEVDKEITKPGSQTNQAVQEAASSAAVANAVNAFNLDSVFESIITSIKPCLLKYDGDSEFYVYVNTPPTNYIRNYIILKENKMQFVESHFVESSVYSATDTEALTLGGAQVYYTSITGADAYKYLTFTNPTVLNGSDTDVTLYQARLPKAINTYVKSEFKWTYNSVIDSYEPQLVFGVGDGQGRGQYKIYKNNDEARFEYISRTSGAAMAVVYKDDDIYLDKNGVEEKLRMIYPVLSQAEAEDDSIVPVDNFYFIIEGLE